jgi:monothiol glutaredoxin
VLKAYRREQALTVNVLEMPTSVTASRNATTVLIPQLYIKGEFVGGSDIMMEMYENGELQRAGRTKPGPPSAGC